MMIITTFTATSTIIIIITILLIFIEVEYQLGHRPAPVADAIFVSFFFLLYIQRIQ